MLGKVKSWHAGLSGISKVAVWAVAAFMGVTVVGAAANPSPPVSSPSNQSDTSQVEPENNEPEITKKTITKTSDIPFSKTTVNDATLEKGKTELRTVGIKGTNTKTYEVTYEDGEEISRKLLTEKVTTKPIAQVTAKGTKVAYVAPAPQQNCDPNYTPCIPNVAYDLDCPDIGVSVRVIGSDPHRFDADHDGYGCESY